MAAVRRAGVLRVASDLSYPPLAFRDSSGPAGFEIDLAGLIAASLGVRLEIVDTPRAAMRTGFAGADLLISEWTADGAPGVASVPYYVMAQAVLWREGQASASGGSLRGVRVAVASRTRGQALAVQAGAAPVVVTYEPGEAFEAVSRGEAQAAVADLPLIMDYARTHRHLTTSMGPWPGVPLVVVARADAPDLAAFVSAAIQELERGHGLARLRQRWRL